MHRKLGSAVLAAVAVALLSTSAGFARTLSTPAISSDSHALFDGRQIDLSQGWGEAPSRAPRAHRSARIDEGVSRAASYTRTMLKSDWLLVLAALKGSAEGLDPIRLQKGMFLFAQQGGAPEVERYDFEPYNYGPMSRELYRDLDHLVHEGLLEATAVSGQTWQRYRANDAGREHAQRLLDEADPDTLNAARRLYEIKRSIVDKGFARLLNDVYDRYPEYAARSVFRRT